MGSETLNGPASDARRERPVLQVVQVALDIHQPRDRRHVVAAQQGVGDEVAGRHAARDRHEVRHEEPTARLSLQGAQDVGYRHPAHRVHRQVALGTKRGLEVDAEHCRVTQPEVDYGADLMIVHHGLFWGCVAPVTGSYYRRLSTLIRNDVALYSSHLPLDLHPEVGNNHVLARTLASASRSSVFSLVSTRSSRPRRARLVAGSKPSNWR